MVREIQIAKIPDSWDNKTHTKLGNKKDLEEISEEENQDIKYYRESLQQKKGRELERTGFLGRNRKYEWIITADNIYFVERENGVLYYRTTVAKKKFPQSNICESCGKTIPNEEESYSPLRGPEKRKEIMTICADCRDEIVSRLEEENISNPIEYRKKVAEYVYSD